MPSAPDTSSQPPNYPRVRHASHTFSHTPSLPQLFAYLSVAAELVIYYVCLHRLYLNYILLGVYSASAGLVIAFALICSCTNPTDRMVYLYKWSKYSKEVKFESDFSTNYYCEYCDSFCNVKSKHCRVCNRCTSNFDHHCIWINNCVGSENYRSFFALIVCTFCHFVLFEIAGALMCFQVELPGEMSYAIPVWVMMGVLAIMIIFLSQLIILHVYLMCRGVTTYEFLMERKKQEQMELQLEREISRKNSRDQKINQSENSNVQIKETQSSKIEVKPKRTDRRNKQNQVQNEIGEQQYQEEEEDEKEQMPSFLKKNKSLKIIFGSSDIEAPKRSNKKLNRIT